MIRPIRHKGLKRLHHDDDPRGVLAEHADKLRRILAPLDAAKVISDMDLPGYRLHALKGDTVHLRPLAYARGSAGCSTSEPRTSVSGLPVW